MKIASLKLTNFRSHRSTAFTLERVTIFRGPNGAGKSSIQDALEFLLTGTTRQTDAGGRGADLLIAHGAKQLEVRAEVYDPEIGPQDAGQIERVRNHAGGSVAVKGPDFGTADRVGKYAEAWIAEYIAPLPVLQAVLNSGRFLSLPEKEQKNLLTAALASKPVAVPEEIEKPMLRLLDVEARARLCLEVPDAATADMIHKIYYDLRTSLNREIKALGELAAPEIPKDTPSEATVKKQLGNINKERDGLLQAKSKRLADHAADRIRLATAKVQFDQFKADILDDAELNKLQKTSGQKTKASAIQAEIDNLTRRITADRNLVKQMREAPDSCYACGRPLVKDDITAKVAELELAIKTAEGLREEAQTRLTKLGDPSTAELKIAAHKKAVIATGSAERALKELKDLPESCDVADLEEDISGLDNRIVAGGYILAEVQQLAGARQQYDQAVAKKQELANRVLAAEKIIAAFGPGGTIRAQLVGDRLAPFTERLNDTLKRFDFECSLSLEPFALQITKLPNCAIPKSVKQLSESEAFRFSVAFQIALAEATGVNFVVIDRSDMLLPELRSTLAETLLESKLDQAIVLAASDLAPVGELPQGGKIYDLDKDGMGNTAIVAEHVHQAKETTYEEIPQ